MRYLSAIKNHVCRLSLTTFSVFTYYVFVSFRKLVALDHHWSFGWILKKTATIAMDYPVWKRGSCQFWRLQKISWQSKSAIPPLLTGHHVSPSASEKSN